MYVYIYIYYLILIYIYTHLFIFLLKPLCLLAFACVAHFVSPSLQASWTGSPLCLPLQPPSRTTTLVRGKGRVQKNLPKNDLICQVDLAH